MIKFLRNTLFLLLVVLIAACSKDSVGPDPTPTPTPVNANEDVVILHLNDIHADINNFPKIAAYINTVRESNSNVFLLSGGDLFSGNPFVDKHEPAGFPMIDLMNHLKFDASVIGNHEFDYGQKILNDRIEQAKFPFVCANIKAENATLNQPEPYTTLKTKSDFPIVVLGLIETGTKLGSRYIPSTHPDKVKGIDFPYYKTELGEYTKLKKENNLLLILSHLGQGADQKIANAYSEIDLIIGGHSHSLISKPYEQNKALICQAGSKGRFIGRVDIKIEDGRVVSKSAKLIEVESLSKIDSEIASIVNKYNNNPVLERVIAKNVSDLSNRDELGSLMTDAVNWKMKTDIAFQNSGGIRSWLARGDIKVKHAYELDPFNNEVIVFEMTCNEIRSLINSAGNGDLKVAGIIYRYQGQSGISLENYNGQQLDESKTYKVGLNSYIASAYTFDHADQGNNSYVTSSNCLIEFLEYKKEINYSGIVRVFGN